jgi:hypothetical protein
VRLWGSAFSPAVMIGIMASPLPIARMIVQVMISLLVMSTLMPVNR